jgi:formylglycine-generating enzyme required for sulfatase activity
MQLRIRFARFVALALGLGGISLSAAAQVTPYGSGINPAGSPQIGASFQLSVRNTAASNPLPGQAFLPISTQPAPGFPAGLPLPGLGQAFPGATDELLIDVGAPNALQLTLGAPTGSIPGVTPIPGLAIIQPGTFRMGSKAASGPPYYGATSHYPVHAVTISKPFWMGTTEVTQAQYQALMGTNPTTFGGPSNPVAQLTWFSAQAYCAALTAQQAGLGNVPAGYQYRLPTEAEWEYACRAGTATEFNLGSALFCNQARFEYSYHSNSSCGPNGTVPVRSYLPNAWGLHDMHGNVFEWCLDSIAVYPGVAVTDPFVNLGPQKVIRGGSFDVVSSGCRFAYRGIFNASWVGSGVGFRLVLAPVLVP